MAKNYARISERRPVKDRFGAFLVVVTALGMWFGCFIGHDSIALSSFAGQQHFASSPPASDGCETPPDWPPSASGPVNLLHDVELLLAPFFSCTSPAALVALQRRVDMVWVVRELDDWSAVRLGSLGPVLPEAADILNHKRASFLVTTAQDYSSLQAEVFALFVINTAFDQDITRMLRVLSGQRRIGQTLGRMAAVREQLKRRGINLADFPDRPEHALRDGGRGAVEAARELLTSMPMSQSGTTLEYLARKRQLPFPYQKALDEAEGALTEKAFESGNVLLGILDEMTFGAPLGLYHLATGVGHGVHDLTRGEYEQATRELTPAALLVAVYASGTGLKARGDSRALPRMGLRLEELKATAARLQTRWGSGGLQELALYLRADPEAALLVAEGGETGAAALYNTRGHVPKARAWLSEANRDRPGPSKTQGGVLKGQEGIVSLVDDVAGLSQQVLDAKLLELELDTQGPRLSGDIAVLEKQWVLLEQSPPAGAASHPLWREYLEYGGQRLTDLRRGTKNRGGRALEPPLKWEGYQQMRGLWLRGLTFEREMVKRLREDAALPRAQRRFLQDFDAPRVESYVGVRKPATDLRFADVLVIEQKPLPGQPPHVETFSFKSRDLSGLDYRALEAQMKADAREALQKYGEALDIRRPGLELHVEVQRVHLIYEGGVLKPLDANMSRAVRATEQKVAGVEVGFQ